MLQIVVLGCGSSFGVPVIGCECDICKSTSPYNKRTRCAIFISDHNTKILVDFGFDIKEQLIREDVKNLDAAILTHDHADHVSGIDNLRVFRLIQGKPLDIFTDVATALAVENRHKYLFANNSLSMNPVGFFDKLTIGALQVQLFKQDHGTINSLGLRIGDFVYSNDVVDFPLESKKYLRGIGVWILDCSDYQSRGNHAGLDKVLKWNEQYQPRQIYLTNMHHNIDYHKISRELPCNISPLYDGLRINIKN